MSFTLHPNGVFEPSSYFSLSDVYFENIIAMAACNLQLESKEHKFEIDTMVLVVAGKRVVS